MLATRGLDDRHSELTSCVMYRMHVYRAMTAATYFLWTHAEGRWLYREKSAYAVLPKYVVVKRPPNMSKSTRGTNTAAHC